MAVVHKKVYNCSCCDFAHKSRRAVDEHYIKNHKYICVVCHTVLPSRCELKEHKKQHNTIPFVIRNAYGAPSTNIDIDMFIVTMIL